MFINILFFISIGYSQIIEESSSYSSQYTENNKPITCGINSYYSPETNSCIKCPRGEYQPNTNHTETSCKECKLGRKVINNGTDCVPCSVGTYGTQPGICEKCPSNQYTPYEQQIHCIQCPDGSSPNTANTKCEKCKKGEYGLNGYCNKCQPGSYTNSESSLMCTLCDQYSIQPKEGMSQCERCPENAFADELRLQCIQCNIFETIDLNKQQCVYTQQFLIIVSVGCTLHKKMIANFQ